MKSLRLTLLACLAAICTGCISTAPPSGVAPVSGFDVERYLGKWYEIARLDHPFERGLTDVTAQYSFNEDGTVRVVNRGYNPDENEWSEAVGRAKFRGDPDVASLKVSFFGPFYGGYHVIELDPDYQWAMVAGPNRGYLWVLSRTPTLDPVITQRLIDRATALGFETGELILVDQTRAPGPPPAEI